jgi:hypothetical protein
MSEVVVYHCVLESNVSGPHLWPGALLIARASVAAVGGGCLLSTHNHHTHTHTSVARSILSQPNSSSSSSIPGTLAGEIRLSTPPSCEGGREGRVWLVYIKGGKGVRGNRETHRER